MVSFEQSKPFVAMIVVNFVLATVNVLFKKIIINGGMSHLVIVTYRQSVAAIFLSPLAYFRERNDGHKLTLHVVCNLFLNALIGATLVQYLFLVGLDYTSVTFSMAFLNMVPINTFVLAIFFGMEKANAKSRAGWAKILGALVSIGGVLVLSLYKGMAFGIKEVDREDLDRENKKRTIGIIVLAVGSLMWSSWFLMQAEIGKIYPCPYSSTAMLSFFSAIQSAVLTLIVERKSSSSWIPKGIFDISSVIYAGMMGSGLCYVVMSWCVKKKGPVFTAAFSPTIQIFVAIFDVFILLEQIHLGCIIGSIFVVIGMYILLWGKSHESTVINPSLQKDGEKDGNKMEILIGEK
ncbi:WAT1-related protein At3g30340-like [Impatiens glandulifera]|uniref:WAT1-related protein At3g30340-like n=1 Tax=Impatiens glandulifera TaxID=253017 RepID=UPI001FB0B6F0|nr:WAT1-related protein At3g30340-like [Impatiens glandulifera]